MVEVIAELGINHNGDINLARKLIDVAYSAGCHYVKFQKRTVDLVYTKEELDKPRESPWGTTTREQKYGLEFDEEYWAIDAYCESRIPWFASPWYIESVHFLAQWNIPFIKVPSALITNREILEACRETNHKIILSTGMSTLKQVDEAIEILGQEHIYCVMHCTSTYPTVPEEINAKCILNLKERYPWFKIGFSNHYPGLMAMLLAVAYGADVIECHITLDRTMYGSDQAASIEPQGLFALMQRINLIERMKGDGIKQIYDSEVPIIAKLRR